VVRRLFQNREWKTTEYADETDMNPINP
jgi:hypothetical protein